MDLQVLSYLAHTHTYDTSHSFASGGMVTLQCSLGQTKWTLSEAEERGEQRMRADAWREEGGRGGEWKWEGCILWNTLTAPTSCLFTWILTLSTLPFLHQSLHPPLTPPPTCTRTHFIPVIVCPSHVIVPTPPYSSTASLPRLST